MSDSTDPAPINPWPLIHRIVYRADAIARTKKLPYAAVIFNRQIQIIPRHAVGVGCEVLWTWTKQDLQRGLTFDAMRDLETRMAEALRHRIDDPPEILCPYDPDVAPIAPQELIL